MNERFATLTPEEKRELIDAVVARFPSGSATFADLRSFTIEWTANVTPDTPRGMPADDDDGEADTPLIVGE